MDGKSKMIKYVRIVELCGFAILAAVRSRYTNENSNVNEFAVVIVTIVFL